jgi:uncharacterized membrane protein YphA (DoxX/SURF4 family)
MIDLLFVGVGWTDLALTLNRIAVGAFFMLPDISQAVQRRAPPFIHRLNSRGSAFQRWGFNQWWVPLVEFTAGGCVLVGLLAPLAALGLLVLILVAIATSGRQASAKPVQIKATV